MSADRRYSVESARAASERGELPAWVARFLASPGSDNALLADKLTKELGWWAGPVRLPLDRLQRLAGPPGEPVLCAVDEDYWDDRVDVIGELAEEGWEPPPVIVAYRHGHMVVEDGNHRVESFRRAEKRDAWAVVGFERRQDRDRLALEWMAAPRDDRQG